MSSCWAVRYKDVRRCSTSEQIETIVNTVSAEQLNKKRINLAIKLIAGGLFLGGIIAGSIFLGRVSPIGAAALVGGVSLTVSAMKILSYAFKIPPFNRHAHLPADTRLSSAEQKHEDFLLLIVKGGKALKKNNIEESKLVKEFSEYHSFIKDNLTRKDYTYVCNELKKYNLDYSEMKKTKTSPSLKVVSS